MTAKELREVLSPLKDEQYICWNVVEGNTTTEYIDIVGYERTEIGDKEDELFVINFKRIH